MPIQVAAHGFEMTEALRTSCTEESKEKLQVLALHNFSAKWTLSLERDEHIAHVNWADGPFRGDASARSADMYGSIRLVAKKAMEQMKKAHGKRAESGRKSRHLETTGESVETDEEG
jgi:ribosome-associated translation inhibitor RaiA